MAALVTRSSFEELTRSALDWSGVVLPLAAIVLAVLAIRGRRRSPPDQPGDRTGARVRAAALGALTGNWQLTLLASTALVLSLASGWTTWDGMRNFTGEPVLSFMITFGIQGVMLIIAWIIGESFASGLAARSSTGAPGSRPRQPGAAALGLAVGTIFTIVLAIAVGRSLGLFENAAGTVRGATWGQLADKSIWLLVGLLLIATLLLNQRSAVAHPYVQSARIIARNAVLWVMFLACMATSVFFSFDSLFASIFPAEERKRAGEIRSVQQVAGLVADLGTLMQRRHGEEAEALFRSDGWTRYDAQLIALARESHGAEQAIEAWFVQQMEARQRAIAEQQERVASSIAGRAGLVAKKAALTDELSRIRAERPDVAANLARVRSELDERARILDEKRIEAQAEEKGAEGSLKTGRGPQWRERMGELTRLQEAYKIQEERVGDAQKRVVGVDQRIARIEGELAGLDGDIGKLAGEARTAEARIRTAEQSKDDGAGPKIDPARVRTAFERARADFRQDPTVERLATLTQQCNQLLSAMSSTPATKDRARDIDCDAKDAAEAANRVFALNAGLETVGRNCAGGDKLPRTGGTDVMLAFGRGCLQDSGLPSRDSGEMAAKLSAVDLGRDDKAHRFVVTWNAFQDGNRLAYLALAIAIAIDSLVFLSGLFGANAVRSPLTDLEGRNDLTADQLEAAIDHTLAATSDPRATLAALLRALHPIDGEGGFTSEIVLDARSPLVEEMRAVLVAGRTIGAVRPASSDRTRYLVSTGLARYFALAQRKTWKIDTVEIGRKELIDVIGVSLLPDPQGNAQIVLSELHPISDTMGFVAEAFPYRSNTASRPLLLRVLGAGATVAGAVQRVAGDERYVVSADVYKTLLLMSAGAIPAYVTDPRAIADDQARGVAVVRALESETLPPRQLAALDPLQPRLPAPVPKSEVSEPGGDHRARSPLEPAPPAARDVSDAFVAEPPSSRGDDRARLHDRIRDELIEQGGLYDWDARDVALAARLGETSDAARALERLGRRAPRLAEQVDDALDDNRKSLRAAYEGLHARNDHDPDYVEALEVVAGELWQHLPLLMLSPGGPYQQALEAMIAELEPQSGEGLLSPTDQLVLARAKVQVDALKRLADDDHERLDRVARIIEHYDEHGPGSASPHAGERRTLN